MWVNEFIKVAVNYGIAGLLLYLSLLFFIIRKLLKTEYPYKNALIGIFISFIILSCFSYPLYYTPVWFLLSYCIFVLFSERLPAKKLSAAGKILSVGVCMAGILFFSFKMLNEIQWKSIAVRSLQGQTQQMLPRYRKIYPYLKHNALFLYNYGAELNVAKQYRESIITLNECQKKFNDYDLQMILADNYYRAGDTTKAILTYQHAANMIPCRFLPLYRLFQICKETGRNYQAKEWAWKIKNKEVKIPSATVSFIQNEAREFIHNNEQ
jgi:O-antigen polymerase